MTKNDIEKLKNNNSSQAVQKSGLFNFFKKREANAHIRQGLDQIFESENENQNQAYALLDNIVKLHHIEVEDVMIPGADIILFPATLKISDAMIQAATKPHSRYPIWGQDRDDVIGFVHIKDILRAVATNQHTQTTVADIKRNIMLAVRSTHAFDLFLRMQLERTHMALVIDEYGGVDGLITIEDLLEQIVGEIHDEHDDSPEPQITALSNGNLLIDARTRLDVLESRLGSFATDQEREECDTLGGLIVICEGRVPVVGEIIKHANSGMEFQIKSASPRLLKSVQIINHQAIKS